MGIRIRDPEFFTQEPGSEMEKFRSGNPGSGINIPDPQHCLVRFQSPETVPSMMKGIERLIKEDVFRRLESEQPLSLRSTVGLDWLFSDSEPEQQPSSPKQVPSGV